MGAETVMVRLDSLPQDIADKVLEAAQNPLPDPSKGSKNNALVLDTNKKPKWSAISTVPKVNAGDKGKYLHANEDTGALEWDAVSGGGGATIVNVTFDGNTATLDKTWQEIHDAGFCVIKSPATPADGFYLEYISAVTFEEGEVTMGYVSTISNMDYTCSTKDGYPSFSFQ